MAPKEPLPPIQLTARRPALDKLPSRTELTDEEIEVRSRAAGAVWGASQQISAPPPPARTARLGMIIPGYLDDQLREASHQRRKSVTALVMEALHQAGYHIDPADLVPDKRRKT